MKKDKKYSDDDGRTIADMNCEGFKWYSPARKQREKAKRGKDGGEKMPPEPVEYTKKERRAMLFAAVRTVLPYYVGLLVAFGGSFLLIYFWLR